MLTSFDKAIAGLIVPIAVALLAHVGFAADDEFTAALTAVVTAIIVWLVPNKAAA